MFSKFLKYDKPLNFTAWAVGILFMGLLVWMAQNHQYYLYISFGLLALPVVYIVIRYPKIWIYSLLLCNIKYFMGSDAGVDVFDVLAAVLYFGGSFTWIMYHSLFKREKLIRNYGDWFFAAFAFISLLNLPLAVLNGVKPLDWFREYVTFIMPLLYFPIRDIFPTRKELKNLLLLFAVSTIFLSIYQLINYKNHITENLIYIYQLGSPIRVNQVVFTASIIVILTFAFYETKARNALMLLIIGSFSIFGILTSLSRTYWAFIFVYLFIVFILIQPRSKLIVLIFVMMASVGTYLGAEWILGSNATKLLQVFAKRFESTKKGTQDYSWKLREHEYHYDFKNISTHPLGGIGYGKKFKIYDMALKYNTMMHFTHNGYLGLSYKLGIPLAIMYILWLLCYTVMSFKTWIESRAKFDKLLMGAVSINFIMIFWANVTATQFNGRDGAFVEAMLVAITGILVDLHKKEQLQNGTKQITG